MTETDDSAPARTGRRKAGLEGMLLPELKQIASGLGLRVSGMRKGQLVEAIKAAQVGGGAPASAPARTPAAEPAAEPTPERAPEPTPEPTPERAPEPTPATAPEATREGDPAASRGRDRQRERAPQDGDQQDRKQQERDQQDRGQQDRKQRRDESGQQDRDQQDRNQQDRDQQDRDQGDRNQQDRNQQDRNQQDRNQDQDQDDEQGGSRRNRRRRGRDRNQPDARPDRQQNDRQQNDRPTQQDRQNDRQNDRQQDRQNDRQQDRQQERGRRGEPDLQILEDDVLAPCAGILDLLDNYAFVRTSGYLPGADDVYVSMSMVRKHGLRRGDAVAGQVRQPREGERREKFNPLVRIDSVNGGDPEAARHRVEFGKLTPVSPSERLRLETSTTELVGRTLDLLAPLGKGQRALLLAPARAGTTTVLQAVAAAVTSNNPECHVMVVLVDERPEELTEYTRSIKGEVIGSTFDRVPTDHTLVAELALERAKRLVELGHDVVLLVDGLARLARAHHLASPSGGRGPSGLDPAAVHQTKRFFGAARNVENGGSLTIVASASLSGGSATDAAILEEIEGTENAEIRLRHVPLDLAAVPLVDVRTSGTRREELLLSEGELSAARELRRTLSALEPEAAAQRLRERLQGSATNLELLSNPRRSTR